MVVFGQSHDVPFGGDLESATARDFDVGTLELRGVVGVLVVDADVELVPVRVSDQNVTGVGNVDAVGKAGHVVVANFAQQLALLAHHDDVVVLEVADVVVPVVDTDVRGLLHEVGTLVELDQFAHFRQNEDSRGYRVHSHDMAFMINGQASHDINEPDTDGMAKLPVLIEDLHPRPLASSVAHDEVSIVSENRHLARIPQATFSFALIAKHEPELAILVENLKKSDFQLH